MSRFWRQTFIDTPDLAKSGQPPERKIPVYVNPEIVKNPRLRIAIRSQDQKRMEEVAFWLLKHYIYPLKHHRGINPAIAMFIAVMASVDRAALEVLGKDKGPVPCQIIIEQVSAFWALHGKLTEKDAEEIIETGQALGHAGGEKTFYMPKLVHLAGLITRKAKIMELAKSYVITDQIQEAVSEIEKRWKDLRVLSLFLMKEMAKRRKYGVKPAYFQDGLLHPADSAWLITDLPNISSLSPFGLYDSSMAGLALAKMSDLSEFRSASLVQEKTKHKEVDMYYLDIGFHPEFFCTVSTEGQLELVPKLLSLQEVSIVEKLELQFSLLQYSTALRLYDLTVPIEAVRQMPRLPRGPQVADGSEETTLHLLDPNLILPRMRWLKSDGADLEFEREREEDEDRTKRLLRKHECVGHTRRLPAGHRASPGARRLAAEDGVTLAEGETYVRKHWRGTVEVEGVMPHRAVQR